MVFDALYRRSLVYNTCWEDPAIDRRALSIGPDDVVLVITSAGCNALDYALETPCRVHAIDANPRQGALLELKVAAIRHLAFDDFWQVFGCGFHPDFQRLYHRSLRPALGAFARVFWDRHVHWFATPKTSFYYRGLSGHVARGMRAWIRLNRGLAADVSALLAATSLEAQRAIHDERIAPRLWGRGMNWVLSRQFTMSLLGVPWAQRREVEAQHAGGVAGFVRESLEYVLRELPLADNYFWRVYLEGRYRHDCCPRYLEPEGFSRLKAGLVDRIEIHTSTVTDFLRSTADRISRFVLLDHMDWMSCHQPEALADEWAAIAARARPGARAIWRSAHRQPAWLDEITIGPDGPRLRDHLVFHDRLASDLTRFDRVHTYAGFHIADLPG
jgi:S-adenosylmethionine-diacylglycerol 3-amino-3-carboxypropyl transferase